MAVDTTKPEPGQLPPDTPKLSPVTTVGQEPEAEEVPVEPDHTVMQQEEPIAKPSVVIAPDPSGRYWTEDRILRMAMAILFGVMAVGLVVSLYSWDVISHVPFLPWLVGAVLLAGPAWRAYTELAEESKGRRIREEQKRTAFGVQIKAPEDRHQG